MCLSKGHVEYVHIRWLQEHSGHLQIYPKWRNLPRGLSLDILPYGQRYYEGLLAPDPLDGLCWELQNFLRFGGEHRLRKCPGCQGYIVQSTARRQIYCGTKRRLKSDPSRREANAKYQSDSRENKIRQDLRKVRNTKARLPAEGITDLQFGWVIDEADIGKRRWSALRHWEEKEYGRPSITDLTRP